MATNKNITLSHYVYRVLIKRLLIMTLIIVVLVSTLVYLMEQRRMHSYVVEKATNAVHHIVSRAGKIMDEKGNGRFQAFHQALSEYIDSPESEHTGIFVYAGFFTPDGSLADEFIDKNDKISKRIKTHFVGQNSLKPAINNYYVRSESFDDRNFIYIVFPIADEKHKVVAYTHAVYAPSEATQTQMRNTILHSVITTVLVILAASLLLYPVILRLFRRLGKFATELLNANIQSISLLGSAIAKRDSDTDAHNYRVTIYAVRLAEAVGLEATIIRSLIKGAFLHDVGKIGIRDNILLKPGKLDNEEFAVMQTHVAHGLDIVQRSEWLADAVDVVGGHHEKFGGGGYPHGLRGQAIPLTARIFAIVDVFDALTSKRPYKEPMNLDAAMEILLKGSEIHFDPELLEKFNKIAPRLYNQYSGREDEGLHTELDEILRQYFISDSHVLMT